MHLGVAQFVLLILLTGCAIRIRTDPPTFQSCAFYCRQTTNCTAEEIPPQLTPQARRMFEEFKPPPTCDTMEVGAKSYADLISAIGTAVAGALVFFF